MTLNMIQELTKALAHIEGVERWPTQTAGSVQLNATLAANALRTVIESLHVLTIDGKTGQEYIGAELYDFQEATGCTTAEEYRAKLMKSDHDGMNNWFLSLPEGRQNVLVEDKWLLAAAAFAAGRDSK